MAIIGAFMLPHPPIIIPQVGHGEEMKIKKTIEAYLEIAKRIAELRPDTLIVSSPHTTIYADYFHISPGERAYGDFKQFGASNLSIEADYDTDFVQTLIDFVDRQKLPAGTLGERIKSLDHGTLIPLYFINKFYTNYKLVRIGLSGLSTTEHYRFGKCIAETAEKLDKRVVFIASGDLSHKLKEEGPYGYAKEGPEFDRQLTEAANRGDFLSLLTFDNDFCERAAECGLRSFIIMAGALDKKAVKPELLSYEGPFGVGYCICAFDIIGEDSSRQFDKIYDEKQRLKLDDIKANEDPYVKLARLSLETFVTTGKKADPPEGLPQEMLNKRAGVFVSLKKHGQLRGCIGTIEPEFSCIAQEIINNAISAGQYDPRFSAVTKEELPYLVYSVDVLSSPEPIDSMSQLDPSRFGVIVSSGHKRGLLLPDLPGVDSAEEQVAIAMQKAGIREGEKISLQRFEVVRHK